MRFKKAGICLNLFLLFSTVIKLSAQVSPSLQWQKSLGGTGDDQAFSVVQTFDNGYIIGGYTKTPNNGDVSGSHGGFVGPDVFEDYWVVKLDSARNIQWKKCYGGTGVDIANSIKQTKDSGYIIAGQSGSLDGDITGHHGPGDKYDAWIVKLDKDGNIQWQKSLGGSANESAVSIQETSDDGYIVAGYTNSVDGDVSGSHYKGANRDYWIVKLNGTGGIIWQKCFGGTGDDYASSVAQTTDGGYVIAGTTNSIDGDVTGIHNGTAVDVKTDYWIIKLNGTGSLVWQKCLGGSGADNASSVLQALDGGYIIAGSSNSTDGDVTGHHDKNDYWIVKLNNTGILQWQKSLGGSANDNATSIKLTADGGYIIGGGTASNNGDITGYHNPSNPNDPFDYWVVRLNSGGQLQWQKCLGGNGNDVAYSIEQTVDYGYIIAGRSSSPDGDVTGNHADFTTPTSNDYWVVKLAADTSLPAVVANFTATLVGNNAKLQWQTSAEMSSSIFGVERSLDSSIFVNVGSVTAAGNSATTQNYSYTDNGVANLNHAKIYYRLKLAGSNGGFSYSNIIPLDINANVSQIQWEKSLGGTGADKISSVRQTPDNGYIIAGSSSSNDGNVTGNQGGSDYWLAKLDNAGVIQWQKTYGGTDEDNASLAIPTADGGYIIAGSTRSINGNVTDNHGGADFWLVKVNSAGVLQWDKCLGGSAHDFANDILQTPDGGYIVTGVSASTNGDVTGNHGLSDYWVVKVSSVGTIQWQKTYGGDNADVASSIQQTPDGGYIIAGSSASANGDVTGHNGVAGTNDYWVVKIDASGNMQWQKSLGGTKDDWGKDIKLSTSNGYVVTGYTASADGDVTNNNGGIDYWVAGLDNTGGLKWQKNFGGSNDDYLSSASPTRSGGFIIAGYSFSNDIDVTGHHSADTADYWIVKIDSIGAMKWQKSLGGSNTDYGLSGIQTNDGGYFITGYSYSSDGDVTGHHGSLFNTTTSDGWVVKLSADEAVLPVTLVSFAGKMLKNDAYLQWKTAVEINSSYFDIERSTNGVNFNSIAKVAAAGNASVTQDYNYTDRDVAKLNVPILYYRLRLVDKNGLTKTSKIVTINVSNAAWVVKLESNPVTTVIAVSSSLNIVAAEVLLADMSGKVINRFKYNLVAGQQVKIPVSQLPAGMYLLTISTKKGYKLLKVLKQ